MQRRERPALSSTVNMGERTRRAMSNLDFSPMPMGTSPALLASGLRQGAAVSVERASAASGGGQTTADHFLRSSLRVLESKTGRRSVLPRTRDMAAMIRRYLDLPVIRACTDINAKAVAATPLRLFARIHCRQRGSLLHRSAEVSRKQRAYLLGQLDVRPSPTVLRTVNKSVADDCDIVEIVDHPLLDLLRRGHPLDTGYHFTLQRMTYLQLTGNAFAHVVCDVLGTPTELWCMTPALTHIVPDERSLIAGFRYGVAQAHLASADGDAGGQWFGPEEVIHWRLTTVSHSLDPAGLYYGVGLVETAELALDLLEAQRAYDLALYENGARPDMLLIYDGNLSDEQYRRMQSAWENRHRGPSNAHRAAILEGKWQAEVMSFPPKDLRGRDRLLEEVAGIFGVPVSMLLVNTPLAGGQPQQGNEWHLRNTVAPLCQLDEEVLNARLTPRFDPALFLAYDSPVPGSIEQQHRILLDSVGRWITPNEARIQQGYAPLADPAADRLTIGPANASDQPGHSNAQTQVQGLSTGPTSSEPASESIGSMAGLRLNGVQINAALDVLARLTDPEPGRRLLPFIAVELLAGVGLPRPTAQAIVDAHLKASAEAKHQDRHQDQDKDQVQVQDNDNDKDQGQGRPAAGTDRAAPSTHVPVLAASETTP